jgi:hypothetical protein
MCGDSHTEIFMYLPVISDVTWITVVRDVMFGTVADAFAEKYRRNGEKN